MKKNFHVFSMLMLLGSLQIDLCAMQNHDEPQDPETAAMLAGAAQQPGSSHTQTSQTPVRQRQEFSTSEHATEVELDSDYEQLPPRQRRRQAQEQTQGAAASSDAGQEFRFESFSNFLEAAAIQAMQPSSPQLELFAQIMQGCNLSNPMEVGFRLFNCDHRNKTLLFVRPLPELLPITQLPSLYQAYPVLALFAAYGNQYNALCGYYAAHATKVFASHPQANDQELIELLNNRSNFDLETLQPGKQTIQTLREQMAGISNLFGEEIEQLLPRDVMNNIIIVGGARNNSPESNEQSLVHRNELVHNFLEGRINHIIWIISSGNHWVTVLSRHNPNREIQLIITDSTGVDRRRMTAIREIYQELTGQPRAPQPAQQLPQTGPQAPQTRPQQFSQHMHNLEDQAPFSIQNVLRAKSGDKNLAGVNFQWADLRSIPDLTNVNLTGANLSGANLQGVNLSGAQLVGTNLTGANLSGANLTDANLRGTTIVQTQFTGVNFLRANLTDATIDHSNFSHSQITEASLRNLRIVNECNFEQAQLTNLSIMNVTITNANFSQAVFNIVYFLESEIDHVNMSSIKVHILFLNNTRIRNINFHKAEFKRGFVIQNTAIIGPNLDFTEAKIKESSIIGNTSDSRYERTLGINVDDHRGHLDSPIDDYTPKEAVKQAAWSISGGVGTIAAVIAVGIFVAPPLAIVAVPVVGAIGIGGTKGLVSHEENKIPYINTVISGANFTGAILHEVRASSLKFVNCIGLDHLEEALGCIFINIFSSNPNDLEGLKKVGARVNTGKNCYAKSHAAFWEKHDESYLADLVTNLGETVVSAFGGEVGKGLAQGALRIFGLAENQQVKKDQSAKEQNPDS